MAKYAYKTKNLMTKADSFFERETTGFSSTRINYSGYGYGRHYAGMTHIYGYDPDGSTFSYICKYHRACVIENMLRDGSWWTVDVSIRNNYATNGYNTRCGVKRAAKKLERIKQIAKSHDVCSLSGKDAHDYRVRLRN